MELDVLKGHHFLPHAVHALVTLLEEYRKQKIPRTLRFNIISCFIDWYLYICAKYSTYFPLFKQPAIIVANFYNNGRVLLRYDKLNGF